MKKRLLFIITIMVLTSCNANTLNGNSTEQPQQEISSATPDAAVSHSYEPEELAEPEVVSSEATPNFSYTTEWLSNSDEDLLVEGAVYCEPGVDYQQDLKHPLIAAVPSLHPVASEFMSVDREAFAGKYEDLNELYKQGIQYKLKGMSRAYYDMFDTIRFDANCKAEVIYGLRVGDSTAKMREVFGEPHFYDGDLKLLGYRFPDFYLICIGENEITEISMTKYHHLPNEYQNIVSEYMGGKMPIQVGIPSEVVRLYPDNTYYYPGGFGQTLLYDNGILFSSSESGGYFLVWNNYEGEIATDTPNTLQFMNEDMYFYFMSEYYRREQTIFMRGDGVFSPDGNIAAFPNNADRPVEGDQIHIRWRDKSHCDITYWTRHTQSDLLWLNNRYLLFNVYLSEPAYLDTLQNKVYPLREAAGISGGKEWAEVSYTKLDGNKLYLYNEPPYMINYSFDKDGNILFQAELSD